MNDREEFESAEDRKLSTLLSSVHAPANPAVWQRVRAEIAATMRPARARGFDAVLAWFTRPAALAAATAVLAVSLGAGYGLLDALSRNGSETSAVAYEPGTLMESLLDDATTATTPDDDGDGDLDGAGGAAADSGGRS